MVEGLQRPERNHAAAEILHAVEIFVTEIDDLFDGSCHRTPLGLSSGSIGRDGAVSYVACNKVNLGSNALQVIKNFPSPSLHCIETAPREGDAKLSSKSS